MDMKIDLNTNYTDWKGMVVFLIQMAGATYQTNTCNLWHLYQRRYGAMEAARTYLTRLNLRQHRAGLI